ncbi:MAG: FAD-dependent monooxygenase [Pseudomonadota bacterium]
MTSVPETKTQVLIVGAGPAGLVMALCLAKCGIKSVIIERQPEINPHPKAHELNTRSLEILASLGISLKELSAEASPKSDGCRIAFCTTVNEEFGAIDLLKDIDDPEKYDRYLESDVPYLNISQTEVERIIRRHVTANPHIDLRLDHEWQSVETNASGTLSSIKDRSDDRLYSITADWLIAADGAGSRVRRALGIEMIGPEKIQDFKNAYFELNLRDHIERPAKLYWIFEPAAVGTFIAHHIEKRWVYNVPIYEPWESPDHYTDEILADRIKYALGLEDGEVEIKSTSVWRMTVQTAEKWRDGRVFLVGDAAHRFPPTGGLGMNSGIGDVHNLAWKLAQVLQTGADWSLLDTYETERKPVAERNAAESLENFERIFDIVKDLGLDPEGAEKAARLRGSKLLRLLPGFVRAGLMSAVNSLVRGRISKALSNASQVSKLRATIQDQVPHFDRIGLDLGYIYDSAAIISDGTSAPPTEVTRYTPNCQPGARFPHIWLAPETGTISSHSLLEYGRWTLLSFGDALAQSDPTIDLIDRDAIQRINIDQLDIPETGKRALKTLCEIRAAGRVLIRPDGHIALRETDSTDRASDQFAKQLARLGFEDHSTQIQASLN